MATLKRYIFLIVALTAACYESPVPISTNANPFDPSLVGTWQAAEADSDDRMSVLQYDNGYYYVEMPWDLGTADTTRLRARAYLTDVEGTTFVNVQDIQGEERDYSFFRLHRNADGSITLAPLKNLPHFDSTDQLRAYLREHVADRAIYDDATRFTKVSAR